MKMTRAYIKALVGLTYAGFLSLFLIEAAPASTASQQLVAEGYRELQEEHYSAALEKFEAAAQTDSLDGDAFFYQGVALNRLGRHQQALEKLKWAAELRVQRPEIGFELGWALLGTRQYQKAVETLELYEDAAPGRGQTSEFLGRAYFELGQYDKADELLQEAVQRDEQLKPAVEYYRALIDERRGRTGDAQQRLRLLSRDFPDFPLAQALRQDDFSLQSPRPYRFFASLGGGYNSNVIALGNTIPLPADISRKSSVFGTTNVGGSYDWRLRSGATLRAGYSFLGEVYEAVHQADLEDHFLYLDYVQNISPQWRASARLSNEYSRIGGNRFRNQVTFRPSAIYRHSNRRTTELAYRFASSNYYFPAPAVLNRDSSTHVVTLTHYFRSARSRLQARVGYFHVWNQADGADYDFRSNSLFAGVSHPLPGKFTGNLFYSRTMDRYANLNSLSGFTTRRRDDVDFLILQLTRPVNSKTELYLQAGYTRNDSNVALFDYRQHVLSGGITARF